MKTFNKLNFWDNITIVGSCWLWNGATTCGYGFFEYELAHRYAYKAFYCVELTAKDLIHHTCKTPLCVCPIHFEKTNRFDHPDALSTINRQKTHCPQGHEYNKDNTYVLINLNTIGRYCKVCARDKARVKYRLLHPNSPTRRM